MNETTKPTATEEFKKFKLMQQAFQKNDGLPVFLKCGLRDKILYYAALGFSGLGIIGSFDFIIRYAFPSKINNEQVIPQQEEE